MESTGKRTRRQPNRYADEAAKITERSMKTKQKKAAASSKKTASTTTSATNASRGKLLKKELAKYNLTRRKDSKLCDAFVKGTTNKSVEEVADVMCRMKYLYGGYCKEFNKEIREVEDEIDREVDDIAEQYKGYNSDPFSEFEGYYRGIRGDACSEVTGYYSFADYKLDVANAWTAFPEQWPWM
ncbi:hypothetical protein QTG54_004520 [Skeletonema marinoi]|uniref:Uncharacterized protein n=1 Tax=Skeletonema marinoi TaxID=267567 RepID=A0AAD9DGI5_9STRA|nr:hypothetical protein QTG54_004520 [Skeletonema marinoi]